MTKKKKKTKKSKVPTKKEPRKDIARLSQNAELSIPLVKKDSSSKKRSSHNKKKDNTDSQFNGCGRLIPIFVGLLYMLFYVTPNNIGYTYYLEKDNEPTTLSFYMQLCGALHVYDLIIAAVIMLFVCWFLLKRGILIMKGGEDPIQDKIATSLLTGFVFILGFCLLPRAFYMTVFQINHMSAEPVSREEAAILEADTETPMFSKVQYYYFVLDVDKGNRYKVYTKQEAYERYQKDSLRTVRVEWSKGVLGYRFISRFWTPKMRRNVRQHTKNHLTTPIKSYFATPESYWHLRVKKDGKWYRLQVRLRLLKMEPKMRREISQGLFGVENDDFEQAYRTYLKSFEEVDSSGLIPQDYPFIDISLMGRKIGVKKKQIEIVAEKTVTQDGSDYDFLYYKTFTVSPDFEIASP